MRTSFGKNAFLGFCSLKDLLCDRQGFFYGIMSHVHHLQSAETKPFSFHGSCNGFVQHGSLIHLQSVLKNCIHLIRTYSWQNCKDVFFAFLWSTGSVKVCHDGFWFISPIEAPPLEGSSPPQLEPSSSIRLSSAWMSALLLIASCLFVACLWISFPFTERNYPPLFNYTWVDDALIGDSWLGSDMPWAVLNSCLLFW